MNKWFKLVDKSLWLRGVWDDEPDKVYWYNSRLQQHRLMLRNQGGAWCGYVSVPWWHPAYFCHYTTLDEFVDVHGGLTFSRMTAGPYIDDWGPFTHQIVNPSVLSVKWFGFDCSHYGDLSGPGWTHISYLFGEGTYRTEKFVEMNIIALSAALKDITWALILKKIASNYLQTMRFKISRSWLNFSSACKQKWSKLKQLLSVLKKRMHA